MAAIASRVYTALNRSDGPLVDGIADRLLADSWPDGGTLAHQLVILVNRDDCPQHVLDALAGHADIKVRAAVLGTGKLSDDIAVTAIACEGDVEAVLYNVAEITASDAVARALYSRHDDGIDKRLVLNPAVSDEIVCDIIARSETFVVHTTQDTDSESPVRVYGGAIASRQAVALWYAEHGGDNTQYLAACVQHSEHLDERAWERIIYECVDAEMGVELTELGTARVTQWYSLVPLTYHAGWRAMLTSSDWSHSRYARDIEEILGVEDNSQRNLALLQKGDEAAFEHYCQTADKVDYDVLKELLVHPSCSTELALRFVSREKTSVNVGVNTRRLYTARTGDMEFAAHLATIAPGSVKHVPVDRDIVALRVINLLGARPGGGGMASGPEIAVGLVEHLSDGQFTDVLWNCAIGLIETVPEIRAYVSAQLETIMGDDQKRALFECLADDFAGTVSELFAAVNASIQSHMTAA